jgi:hypothetical protein
MSAAVAGTHQGSASLRQRGFGLAPMGHPADARPIPLTRLTEPVHPRYSVDPGLAAGAGRVPVRCGVDESLRLGTFVDCNLGEAMIERQQFGSGGKRGREREGVREADGPMGGS